MKALEERVKEAVATVAGETSAIEAYKRVLWVLEEQLDEYERVWSPRADAAEFAAMKAGRQQLVDDLTLVAALLAHAEGRPVPTQFAPPRRKPRYGY